jgi:VWFA-related protein
LSPWFSAAILAVLLAFQQQSTPQQSVPSAPAPQSAPLKGVPASAMTPGTASQDAGTGGQSVSPNGAVPAAAPANASSDSPPATSGQAAPANNPADNSLQTDQQQQGAPEIGQPGKDEEQQYKTFRVNVNFVIVPVQVRDKGNQLVGGLTWRDFEVFEDNRRQRLSFFSSDSVPISAALVIDQTLTSDTMAKVNLALRAIAGGFTPYDEIAIFTYANGVTPQSGFTAATSDRLTAVLAQTQVKGREMGAPIGSGPLASGPTINGRQVDPNLSPFHGDVVPIIPKEIHTLNDAIFEAGKLLSHTEPERRRVIYVISDGKEQGSHVSQKEVERFLLTNNIGVYGTVVGDSAVYGLGYLDKIHLPLLPRNNILPNYALRTGGTLDSEVTRDGIERSFQRVVGAARTEYTLGYNSPSPATNPAYRKIEVRVNRPGLTIIAKEGYYPTPVRQR